MTVPGCSKTIWLVFAGLLVSGCLPLSRTDAVSQDALAPEQSKYFDLERSVGDFLKP
jgi:hypothetical protein